MGGTAFLRGEEGAPGAAAAPGRTCGKRGDGKRDKKEKVSHKVVKSQRGKQTALRTAKRAGLRLQLATCRGRALTFPRGAAEPAAGAEPGGQEGARPRVRVRARRGGREGERQAGEREGGREGGVLGLLITPQAGESAALTSLRWKCYLQLCAF